VRSSEPIASTAPTSDAATYSRWARVRTVTPAILAALLTGCSGPLNPQGPVGQADRTIMLDALGIMLAIVVPTIIATLAFAWWFRASNTKARFLPQWTYSGRIELVVWSIPTLVILFLGGVIWIGAHELDPAQPLKSSVKPLEVQAVSLDWKWLFIYPDQGIAAVNTVAILGGFVGPYWMGLMKDLTGELRIIYTQFGKTTGGNKWAKDFDKLRLELDPSINPDDAVVPATSQPTAPVEP